MNVPTMEETESDVEMSSVEDKRFQTDASGKVTQLQSLLEDLGLQQCYKNKLSLRQVLQIDEKAISDDVARSNSDLPWYFLKKLMMVNVAALNVKCTSVSDSNRDVPSGNTQFNIDELLSNANSSDRLNPLDIITALFLCSDSFVQQEIALKMSMCQFSVPLLLPSCDTKPCTLMLWAMRDIVKKYRPQSLLDSKGFREERIVFSQLPMISFVRLGECSLSKSEILNKVLSNPQQYHDTFVHQNMECGDSPRRISNGLVEMTWYLPCGTQNIDIFTEPVAVANLRGDIASFETQFSFLCQTSSAVFVFFEDLNSGLQLLTNQPHKAQIFLVGNHQSKQFNADALKKVATQLKLTNTNIILKTKRTNDADFVTVLRQTLREVVARSNNKMQMVQMAETAHELGILVDENTPDCQNAKRNADAITEEIRDTFKYKETQLPRQGKIWKELASLEKEEFRLCDVGTENVEDYKSKLKLKKQKLREKQSSYKMSNAMILFINAISSSEKESCFFLKWMRMNLDNLSREQLSDLREQYKEKSQSSQNKEEIKHIDKQLSNGSLGIEHFFREMGQIYEASLSLAQEDPARRQLEGLPKLCAKLMLEGFPIELVDGDASNIPLRWVSDVLSQLNALVSPKNKIVVVTVLGVQSTGKSTLLNTMFGVQFAVSSGRCTRGAFMLLIRISEDMKKVLNCDFMMIIDTEGLKSPELAQLDDSYEHDNELATLVVGLSDITIINIAMENSTEMKDILQIVVHAFLRMKEVGKKPKCQFVHQNVSDVSAHDKNMRDRNLLLQQLNEMTQAAAKMEKKEKNKNFTDVMEYNPETGNWYIPGLWNGSPPMAPVSAGYSEAVYDLKKNIIQILRNNKSANNIMEFTQWMTSLWNAVKHENFIFSFRNSLVADAYMNLCSEFNKWEWKFKTHMYDWVTKAETRISNFGERDVTPEIPDVESLVSSLKSSVISELSGCETELRECVIQYFKQTGGHVKLVEGYKETFIKSAECLRVEMENSVKTQLTAAAEMKQGMSELDRIQKNHTSKIEMRVNALIEKCRKKGVDMSPNELNKEFDEMWLKTVSELKFSEQKETDVFNRVARCLRQNVSSKGSHANKMSQKHLRECGVGPFKYKPPDKWTDRLREFFIRRTAAVQAMADSTIAVCIKFVDDKVQTKSNYHDTYVEEILRMIDARLETNKDLETDIDFEVSLKLHICGIAARRFLEMHRAFIKEHDPSRCLNESKEVFREAFKDAFTKSDTHQKKAQAFTTRCLKTALEDIVKRSLGTKITGEMRTLEQFSTRMSFQYFVLLDLLKKNNVELYLRYIRSYEEYVSEWIFNHIVTHCGPKVSGLEDQIVQSAVNKVNQALDVAKERASGDLKQFVDDVCRELTQELTISQADLSKVPFLKDEAGKEDIEQFVKWLKVCIEDLTRTLRMQYEHTHIEDKLQGLTKKPQDELLRDMIGCGKQCPFCKAPCDAGGTGHSEHWTKLHRSQALGSWRWTATGKLVTDICSSLVVSDCTFQCSETNSKWQPYKRYREIFKDWSIPPDISLEASDYWKYVLAKFNNDFATAYGAKAADIPTAWSSIKPQDAENSLKLSFGKK